MKLESVIPWGRTFGEYRRMFQLTDEDLTKTVIGIGDGPASFNAELHRMGHSVVSIDPIYAFSADEIASRIEQTYETVINQMRQNALNFNWTDFRNEQELGVERMRAMKQFLADYETGKKEGRYRPESLPTTSFGDCSFDLALCSHLLFLYSAHLSEAFHRQAVREMLRIAAEVRIFPLVDLTNQLSPFVKTVSEDCRNHGFTVAITEVPYHFQKTGNQMLVIRKHK